MTSKMLVCEPAKRRQDHVDTIRIGFVEVFKRADRRRQPIDRCRDIAH